MRGGRKKKKAASIIAQMSQAAFQRRENLHFPLLLGGPALTDWGIFYIYFTQRWKLLTFCCCITAIRETFLQIGTNKICGCNIYIPLDTNASASVEGLKYTFFCGFNLSLGHRVSSDRLHDADIRALWPCHKTLYNGGRMFEHVVVLQRESRTTQMDCVIDGKKACAIFVDRDI